MRPCGHRHTLYIACPNCVSGSCSHTDRISQLSSYADCRSRHQQCTGTKQPDQVAHVSYEHSPQQAYNLYHNQPAIIRTSFAMQQAAIGLRYRACLTLLVALYSGTHHTFDSMLAVLQYMCGEKASLQAKPQTDICAGRHMGRNSLISNHRTSLSRSLYICLSALACTG